MGRFRQPSYYVNPWYGAEGLIKEMGEPERSLTVPPQPEAPPDEAKMERLAAIGARYGAETLGPLPKHTDARNEVSG